MPDTETVVVDESGSRPVVVVSYGLSKQIELGTKDSPWHNSSVTFSIPLEEGQDPQETADEWIRQAKTFVLSELDVPAALNDDGTLQPDLVVPAKKTGGRKTSAPAAKSNTSEYPTIEINGTTWVDYREAKAAEEKPARFPDFKTPDNKRSEWIRDKDGNVKEEFAAYA